MDPMWIGGLITAIGVAASGVIGSVAILRKAMQPDSDARSIVRSVWDLIEAGVIIGAPRSLVERMRRLLEVAPDDAGAGDQGE